MDKQTEINTRYARLKASREINRYWARRTVERLLQSSRDRRKGAERGETSDAIADDRALGHDINPRAETDE